MRHPTIGAAAAMLACVIAAAMPRAQSAPTQTFVPERFYTTFSAAHPPALRIRPGQRIVTKSVDASGVDWAGKQVTSGPNPQTGPFFVEGAEPGDRGNFEL